jgi:allophanate hydrolase subunit 1
MFGIKIIKSTKYAMLQNEVIVSKEKDMTINVLNDALQKERIVNHKLSESYNSLMNLHNENMMRYKELVDQLESRIEQLKSKRDSKGRFIKKYK